MKQIHARTKNFCWSLLACFRVCSTGYNESLQDLSYQCISALSNPFTGQYTLGTFFNSDVNFDHLEQNVFNADVSIMTVVGIRDYRREWVFDPLDFVIVPLFLRPPGKTAVIDPIMMNSNFIKEYSGILYGIKNSNFIYKFTRWFSEHFGIDIFTNSTILKLIANSIGGHFYQSWARFINIFTKHVHFKTFLRSIVDNPDEIDGADSLYEFTRQTYNELIRIVTTPNRLNFRNDGHFAVFDNRDNLNNVQLVSAARLRPASYDEDEDLLMPIWIWNALSEPVKYEWLNYEYNILLFGIARNENVRLVFSRKQEARGYDLGQLMKGDVNENVIDQVVLGTGDNSTLRRSPRDFFCEASYETKPVTEDNVVRNHRKNCLYKKCLLLDSSKLYMV